MIDIDTHMEMIREAFPSFTFLGAVIKQRTWCESTGRYSALVTSKDIEANFHIGWHCFETRPDGKLLRIVNRPVAYWFKESDSAHALDWVRGDA